MADDNAEGPVADDNAAVAEDLLVIASYELLVTSYWLLVSPVAADFFSWPMTVA